MTRDLRYRQIHLDFHTSPDIPGIGAAFDPDAFADTLKRAHVDSITCFARCHHGHLYYQTKAHPERIHPHLAVKDLLEQQIAACHDRGIRVPIYSTVQWDEYSANAHREWLSINPQGELYGTRPFSPGFYRVLDVLHPGYRQFMRDHLADIFACVPSVDGIFLDIVGLRDSVAPHWIESMDRRGYDPENADDRRRHCIEVIDEWKLETTQFIRSLPQYRDDCTIFYNAGHVGPRHRTTLAAYTHYELESLPSGGWGYTHFPLAMRYAEGLSKDHAYLGMTGKFHTSWGDFSSYKNPAALHFECFNMLSLNARCSIGDQLPPSGAIDAATYELVGDVYADVETREPWCRNAHGVREIGVLTPEEFAGEGSSEFVATTERQPAEMIGLVHMLQEMALQFDILDTGRDFSQYRLLILPDRIPVDKQLRKKLQAYLRKGGRILASYASGLDAEGAGFALEELDVSFVGKAPYSPDFIVPAPGFDAGLPPTGHVMYNQGVQVKAGRGTKVLAKVETPYFNRNWRHFCSHRHTPSSGKTQYPGIIQNTAGNTIYFMHPVFTQYHDNAPLWCKKLVAAAIRRLMGEPIVVTDGPSSLIANLSEQPDEKRYVLHLLHYIPERRGKAFDILEDVIPLHDLSLSLALPKPAASARLVPAGDDLPLESKDERQTIRIPKLHGHAMVELAY